MAKKKNCWECRSGMEERIGYAGGVTHRYWHCTKCGDEVVDMEQLHEAAERQRELVRRVAKISKWGTAIAVRIPKEIVDKQKIQIGQEAFFSPEKEGFRVVLQKLSKIKK